MITTIDYNQLKRLSQASGSYLLWEGVNRFEVYYINQGPVIFRAIVKKDGASFAFISGLKGVIVIKDQLIDLGTETAKLIKLLNRKK